MALSFDTLIEKAQAKAEDAVGHPIDHEEFVAITTAVLDAMEMCKDERGNVITRYTVTPTYEQRNFRSTRARRRR